MQLESTRWRDLFLTLTHFNPTLVQLEFVSVAYNSAGQANFNPTLVQLELRLYFTALER